MHFNIILLLVINGLLGGPCGLERNKPVYADTITDCLKSIPIQSKTMSPNLLKDYIGILIEYVYSSSYFYLYMDTPDGWPSYNTLQDLKDLRDSINGNSNFFNVCEQIHIILSRLKDCRVGAGYPYLGNFVYFLPFAFTTANVFNSDNITHLELVPNTYTDLIAKLPLDDEGPDKSNENLQWLLNDVLNSEVPNFVIKEIDFTSGNKSAYLPASHALSYYALKENDYMRDPHGSYNFVIKGYLMSFNAAYMMHPTEPGKYNQHIWLKGQNLSSKSIEDVEIDVPFWGLYRGPQEADFDDLSPLVTSSSSSSSSSAHFTSFSNKNFGKKLPHRGLHPSEDKETRRNRTGRTKAKNYTSPLVKSEYEKMMKKRRTPSVPESLQLSAPPTVPVKFETLYEYIEYDYYVLCRVLSDPVNKIGYLLFLEGYDFEDITKPDLFYTGLGEAYRKMVNQGIENVIVDMRGHEGGYVSVFEAIFDFLFHNAVYPRSTESDVIKSQCNAEVIRFFQKYPEKMGLDFSEWQPFIVHYDDETVTKVHVDRSRYPPKALTADHTTRLFCEECIPTTISKAYGGYSPYDAQHLYLLTDGDCFGGCAIMTLQAVELNAARVLGYGWNPAFEHKLQTYAPGSCTGTYWGSDIIQYLQYGLDEEGYINASNLPTPWKWDDPRLHFTFTHFEEFSRNPTRLGESLLYSNATVHEVLPFKVNAEEITVKNAEDVAQQILNLYIAPDYCFAGEVRPDPACQTPERNALHQRYGRPCETVDGKPAFSKDKCLYAYCELGYYFNGTLADFGGDCVPIPGEAPVPTSTSEKGKEKDKDKFPGWGVALIVIVVILAVVVVVLIAVIITSKNKGKVGSIGSLNKVSSAPAFQENPNSENISTVKSGNLSAGNSPPYSSSSTSGKFSDEPKIPDKNENGTEEEEEVEEEV